MSDIGSSPNALPSRTHNCLSGPLSTKYTLRIRNLCAQHDTVAESKKCHTVTCVRVNAIRTILQFTLVTHGDLFGVKLGATKGTNIPIITHNILIIIVLLCRCGPYMCRYVFPWTIWRVSYLSSNQKLLQMQEYTHVLMQHRTGSPPYVPYDAPMPQEGGNAMSPLHSRGSPKEGEQNQKSKPRLGVTMMHHATKRGFKDCPGFFNSTGRLGPKRGRKCYVTPAFSGVPNKREQNQKAKPRPRVTMMHHKTKRGFKELSRFPQ